MSDNEWEQTGHCDCYRKIGTNITQSNKIWDLKGKEGAAATLLEHLLHYWNQG